MRKIINSTYIGVVKPPHEWPTVERPSHRIA
jgi:hypothetical protein